MSEGQENQVPAPSTRLPRLASSPAAKPSLRPLTTGVNGNKRKTPSSPAMPLAKRAVSNPMAKSTTTAPSAKTGGFVPTSRKTSGTLGSAISRPGTSLAASTRRPPSATSTASASSSTAMAGRPRAPATTAGRRPPVAAAPRGTALGRSVGPSRGVGVGVGRGGPGAGAVQDGQLGEMRNQMGEFKDLLTQERDRIDKLQMSQADLQKILLQTENTEREARRELSTASEEIAALRSSHSREVDELERTIARKDREKRNLEEEMQDRADELSRERQTIRDLKQQLAQQSTQHMTLSAQLTAAQTQNTLLQAEIERATLSVSTMKAEVEVGKQKNKEADEMAAIKVKAAEDERDRRVAEIEDELRAAETIRRKLHNQVQELKGNIRVFARVRPALSHESDSPDALADIAYGDERLAAETGQGQMIVSSKTESATGKEREQVNTFAFDKIFQPVAGQKEVFEEISMLAQSVLDGYNVCIFAYGQTGSGKSWTMEGGQNEEDAGMIPRAIDMIFTVSSQLRDRGWKYQMEGQFLEVYNEVINDLLGSGQFDTKKHEIKHDKDGKMSVTDAVSIPLSSPRSVATLLERARSRRAVAATLMNERSSRSHSVFTLKVKGVNPLTDEKCEAMLNLVDLAGSERLATSGAGENKDRLKETININKSLSALADVIGALGQGQQGGHVPYRNSTLTRLLQTSLSGSSKTLMLCNLSPLAAHLGETLCSLRFATKVNSTVVGSAKKQVTK